MAKFYTGEGSPVVEVEEVIQEVGKKASQKQKNKDKTNKDLEALKEKIIEYKYRFEADSVSCLYSNPELYEESLMDSSFFSNNYFRVLFNIFVLVYDKGYSIQEDSIWKVLGEHQGLRKVYEDNGGYSFIEGMTRPKEDDSVSVDSFRADVKGLKKWNCVLSFAEKGFPMDHKLMKIFADMETDEEICDYYFLMCDIAGEHVEGSNQIHNALEDIDDIVDSLDEEIDHGYNLGVGNSFFELNKLLTGGFHPNGNIYGLGAMSGTGKSTLALMMLLPIAFASRQELNRDHESKKIMFIVNEEGAKKWEKDILVWIVNNISLPDKPHNYYLNKAKFQTGGFTSEDRMMIQKARDWWKEGRESTVYIVPLKTYSVDNVIKEMKRSKRRYGIDIFCIDTLKESRDTQNVDTWKAMERDMVRLYDTVKPEGLNVGLFVTYQLAKQARKIRYLTESEIGQAKNIADVMSVNIMIRKAFPDEYAEGQKAIGINKKDESGQLIKSHDLLQGRNYMVTFLNKNRFGQTDPYQIVAEIDHGCLKYKEIGTTYIPTDF